MISANAQTALRRLVDGNHSYRAKLLNLKAFEEKRPSLVSEQKPFAIILSCSDSRVPSEIVFDQGLGDLFVVRVAGNIVAPSIIGSIEFAAATFGTELVVVMGHSNCGAIATALECQLSGEQNPSENIRDIVDRISPAIKPVIREAHVSGIDDKETLLNLCIHSNILASINNLSEGSQTLRSLVNANKLSIVGAEYCLKSGKVSFFDGDHNEAPLKENVFPQYPL